MTFFVLLKSISQKFISSAEHFPYYRQRIKNLKTIMIKIRLEIASKIIDLEINEAKTKTLCSTASDYVGHKWVNYLKVVIMVSK